MAVVATNSYQPHTAHGGNTDRGALAVVTTLFLMWGFCTVLNDALIPHLQSIFALSYLQASLIQLAFFGSYFLFALPAGKLVEWIGYQRTMVVGLITMSAGALLFLPAASSARYAFFLAAQVVLAAGVTILQVSANPHVTAMGYSIPSRYHLCAICSSSIKECEDAASRQSKHAAICKQSICRGIQPLRFG